MVGPEKNVHFPKPAIRICKILLSVFSKARAVLSWAEPHLSIANKETPILRCKCSRYWNCNKKTFSFSKFANYISSGLPVQKMSSLLCAGATCRNSRGHKWGKSSLGGNVKVNDCWRKRGKVVCDQAATVSPGASQVSGSKRLKHTFGQLQRLTPATNRPSTESGSLSIWTDRPDKRSSGCAIAAISDDFAGTSNPLAGLIRNLKRDNWLIRGVIRLFPPNATTPNLDGNVPGI